MKYNAADPASLRDFADRLRALSVQKQAVVQADLHSHGLMRTRNIVVRPIFALMLWWKGGDVLAVMFLHLAKRHPKIITDMTEDTVKHMVYGLDTEDVHSVGGFSQRELDMISAIVA